MRGVRELAAVAVLVSATAAAAVPATAAEPAAGRTWLALGDSYSSGEGIPGTTEEKDSRGKECARATGSLNSTTDSDARAWGVVAYDTLNERDTWAAQDFVACTGAINDDWYSQVAEAQDRGRSSWDVVTFSFGGNSIGFADIISGCLDIPDRWDFALHPGCDIGLERFQRRVDMLVGDETPTREDYRGSVTLPELYDQVAGLVEPGGQVIVAGYPQIVEDPALWSRWQRGRIGCHGLWIEDADLLRSAGDYLNTRIRQAVADADRLWSSKGVTFTFADLTHEVYETGEVRGPERHSLCAEKPWLNGVTLSGTSGDFRKMRSFHPNQDGHTATGRYVASLIRGDAAPGASFLYDLTSDGVAVGPTGTRRSYQEGVAVSSTSTSFWVGCDSPAVTTFTLPPRADRLDGSMLLDPAIAPAALRVRVDLFAGADALGSWTLKRGDAVSLARELPVARTLELRARKVGGECTTEDIGYGVLLDARVA